MIDVCLLGTGGMMPLPYRALTSLLLRYNGGGILLDCGEATQISVRRRGWSFHDIDVILITHFHADHISGLPGMLLAMGNADRTEPVTIVGPPGIEHVVRSLCVIAPHLPFPLQFIELNAPEVALQLLGLEIHAFQVNHNMLCYAYSFTLNRPGKFDAEKAKALQIPVRCWNRLQHGQRVTLEDGRIYTGDMVMGPARPGLKVTYATDTRPTEGILREATGADLFICEGMYGEPGEESLRNARAKKHMTMYEAAEIGREAQPREMWLTHFSPKLVNPKDYEKAVQQIFPRIHVVKDRMTRILNFRNESDHPETGQGESVTNG